MMGSPAKRPPQASYHLGFVPEKAPRALRARRRLCSARMADGGREPGAELLVAADLWLGNVSMEALLGVGLEVDGDLSQFGYWGSQLARGLVSGPPNQQQWCFFTQCLIALWNSLPLLVDVVTVLWLDAFKEMNGGEVRCRLQVVMSVCLP